jgi:hypothetical protein
MDHDTTTEGQVDAARVQQARTNLSAPVQALLTLLMEKSAQVQDGTENSTPTKQSYTPMTRVQAEERAR